MELIERILAVRSGLYKPEGRPLVTLSYAQSLDGSIAARRGEQLILSGDDSSRLTHQLRARHDGIMVGIGTVLADDPRLTVRHVAGKNPQPVILDSQLRIPSDAALIQSGLPWIATTDLADSQRVAEYESEGIRMISLPHDPSGQVNLPAVLRYLKNSGIETLMVEGGARVITSFLAHRLVDLLVLTVSPLLLGGLQAIERPIPGNGGPSVKEYLRIEDLETAKAGPDLIIWGRLT